MSSGHLSLQSPSPTVTGSPSYVYPALHTTTELMYAQPPPQAYQPELTEASMLEGAPVEVKNAALIM